MTKCTLPSSAGGPLASLPIGRCLHCADSRRPTRRRHAGCVNARRTRLASAIEDAAWELFAEQGYDETSINDIAERANVAPRTFFRYFPTKEAVMYPEFDELLELGARRVLASALPTSR